MNFSRATLLESLPFHSESFMQARGSIRVWLRVHIEFNLCMSQHLSFSGASRVKWHNYVMCQCDRPCTNIYEKEWNTNLKWRKIDGAYMKASRRKSEWIMNDWIFFSNWRKKWAFWYGTNGQMKANINEKILGRVQMEDQFHGL